jgi:flagellar biogenesis protein FliO
MAEAMVEPAPSLSAMPSLWLEFIKILAILGSLLGGLLLILHFWRKPFWSKKPSRTAHLIQVLATHYLEPRKSLILIQVGGQQFLLANTVENLTLLTRMKNTESGKTSFSNTLDQAVKQVPEETGI